MEGRGALDVAGGECDDGRLACRHQKAVRARNSERVGITRHRGCGINDVRPRVDVHSNKPDRDASISPANAGPNADVRRIEHCRCRKGGRRPDLLRRKLDRPAAARVFAHRGRLRIILSIIRFAPWWHDTGQQIGNPLPHQGVRYNLKLLPRVEPKIS